MNNVDACKPYILGLDLGVASIGWARIECDAGDRFRPLGLLAAGSHLFESGTEGTVADIEKGKDEARNVQRRTARLMRRQTWRRARRKRVLLKLLIRLDLLPQPASLNVTTGGDLKRPLDIDTYMKALDARITAHWVALRSTLGHAPDPHTDQQRMLYVLREAAAKGPIERHEFGRALYHLAQRRGFLSNRRAPEKKDEKAGDVKAGIDELSKAIEAHGAAGGVPTLGAYLASIDPFADHDPNDPTNPAKRRIRHRWTSRKMYEDEFALMWSTQAAAMGLDDQAKKEVHRAIFYQRPLKEPKRTIGRCFFEPKQARLRLAHPIYQEFRFRQVVNDLRVLSFPERERSLTGKERDTLCDRLKTTEELTFEQVRRICGLPEQARFSHERTTIETYIAHRSGQPLREAFPLKRKGTPAAANKSIVKLLKDMQIESDVADPRPLSVEEQARLADAWVGRPELTLNEAREVIGDTSEGRFLVVKQTTNRLIGNRTEPKLRRVLGKSYDALSEQARARLISDLCAPLEDAALKALLVRPRPTMSECDEWLRLPSELRGWGFTEQEADELSKVKLEERRGALSLLAIQSLLPHMRKGISYASAVQECYPSRGAKACDSLPPIACFNGHANGAPCYAGPCGAETMAAPVLRGIRNPSVQRTLSELRKLVNEMVRHFGPPVKVRVELARDLKNPRMRRREMTAANDRRKDRNEVIADRIAANFKEHGIPEKEIGDADVEKVLLADECRWRCPYTDKQISWSTLFTEFDVEHIWPLSRWPDDSLLNKTICARDFNRNHKRGHIPSEALSGEEFERAIRWVKKLKTDWRTRAEKVRRFAAAKVDDDFVNRHLSDTRYIAKAAAAYLGLLYGGVHDPSQDGVNPGTRRIEVGTGRLTKFLRSGWGLSRLLGTDVEKNREDHRHHAVDAIVVALTDAGTNSLALRALSESAAAAEQAKEDRHYKKIRKPWEGIVEDARRVLDRMIVSHRQSRKVTGPLHDLSIWSKPIGKDGVHRIRKELFKLTVSEIREGKIVDKRALEAIRAVIKAKLGTDDPDQKKLTALLTDPANAPLVRGHDEKMVRLRKVRVELQITKAKKSKRKVEADEDTDSGPRKLIGNEEDATERWIKPANNHHTIIVEVKDTKGRVKWEDRPVQLIDAYARQAAKRPIVDRSVGPNERFLFSLARNDFLEMDVPDDSKRRDIYRVTNISEGQSEVMLHSDGRPVTALRADKKAGKKDERIRIPGEKLRKLNARKVHITYLGEVRNAGG